MAKEKPRYKFLTLVDGKVTSSRGGLEWHEGEWHEVKGKIVPCGNGLHCSVRMIDAMSYAADEIVARVEVDGRHADEKDKEAWQKMRLVDIRQWRKEDSVALSIFAAEKCIAIYEEQFPDDDRPRKAIEAAKKWLAKPTEANCKKARSAESAAWSAARSAESAAWSAAWSAESAESAAWSAARSAAWSAARSAARSAESAAWSAESAARSAESAARSAESAAWSVAWSAGAYEKALDEINEWMEARFEELPKVGEK